MAQSSGFQALLLRWTRFFTPPIALSYLPVGFLWWHSSIASLDQWSSRTNCLHMRSSIEPETTPILNISYSSAAIFHLRLVSVERLLPPPCPWLIFEKIVWRSVVEYCLLSIHLDFDDRLSLTNVKLIIDPTPTFLNAFLLPSFISITDRIASVSRRLRSLALMTLLPHLIAQVYAHAYVCAFIQKTVK